MKKLDDIPKKNIFEVPEGYFERLPGVIQARVTKPGQNASWNPWLVTRLALPVLLLVGAGIFWFSQPQQLTSHADIEYELSQIDQDQLSLFLDDNDLQAEELMETVTWSEEDLRALEEQVYSGFTTTTEELDALLEDFDDGL
ncbi:MAG: hypothetical protein ACK5DD_00600 [Cyclobacteriaceae bacterium]|jgi:hypothetical protein